MGRADWTGRLDFETVNGSIKLDLPADLSADVDAETVNGRIEVDFPLSGNVTRPSASCAAPSAAAARSLTRDGQRQHLPAQALTVREQRGGAGGGRVVLPAPTRS